MKNNRKKAFFILLALLILMLLSFVNVVSGANAFKYNNTEYASLKSAIAAVPTNSTATIEMLDNYSGSDWISYSNKDITLDLKGHSYSRSDSGAAIQVSRNGKFTLIDTVGGGSFSASDGIGIETKAATAVININSGTVSGTTYGISSDNGTVNVNNGTIKGGGESGIKTQSGTITVSGGTITGGTVGILDYANAKAATIIVSGGIISTTGTGTDSAAISLQDNNSKLTVSGNAQLNGGHAGIVVFREATVEVNGGAISGNSFGITGNGSTGLGGYTIVVNDGTITGTIGIYHPNAGKVTITGGTISGTTGIYQKSGTLNITGGTITGTGIKADYSYNGNGANSTGDALVIDSCNYPGGAPTVSISGGSFKSTNNQAVGGYTYNGGTAQTKFISGGVFSSAPSADYAANGYVVVEIDDATYKYGLANENTAKALTITKDPSSGENTDNGVKLTAEPKLKTITANNKEYTVKYSDYKWAKDGSSTILGTDKSYTTGGNASDTGTYICTAKTNETEATAKATVTIHYSGLLTVNTNGGTGTGTVKSDPASLAGVAGGTQVTLTAVPDDGSVFAGWKVVSGAIQLTDDQVKNAEISFTMPEEEAELTASFTKVYSATGDDFVKNSDDESADLKIEFENKDINDIAETLIQTDQTTVANKDGVLQQKPVYNQDFTIEHGSVIIHLKDTYLNTLEVGEYRLTAVFNLEAYDLGILEIDVPFTVNAFLDAEVLNIQSNGSKGLPEGVDQLEENYRNIQISFQIVKGSDTINGKVILKIENGQMESTVKALLDNWIRETFDNSYAINVTEIKPMTIPVPQDVYNADAPDEKLVKNYKLKANAWPHNGKIHIELIWDDGTVPFVDEPKVYALPEDEIGAYAMRKDGTKEYLLFHTYDICMAYLGRDDLCRGYERCFHKESPYVNPFVKP